jgi:hypothetical protein
MSVVNVVKESLPEFLAGHGTVGTDEQKISEVNLPVHKHIVIRAASDNGGEIMVSSPGRAAEGFILAQGEQTPPIYVDETDKVAVVGSEADQDYSWLAC